MRIVTFSVYGDSRLGLFTDKGVVDLARACSKYSSGGLSTLFSDTRAFLKGGEFAMKLAREIGDAAHDERPSASAKEAGTLVKSDRVRLLAPILDPQKIYCAAVNYVSHGAETGTTPPVDSALKSHTALQLESSNPPTHGSRDSPARRDESCFPPRPSGCATTRAHGARADAAPTVATAGRRVSMSELRISA